MKKRGLWLRLYFLAHIMSLIIMWAILRETQVKIGDEIINTKTIIVILSFILIIIYEILLHIFWRCQSCGKMLPMIGPNRERKFLPNPWAQSCPKCDTDIC